jgi:hypothetical protein
MALVYDNTRTAKQGGGYIERADPLAFANTELPALRAQAAERLARSQARWKTADKFAYAGAAVPFAFAAAPALSSMFSAGGAGGGASAAAPGGWSMPGVSAPVFGGGSGAATSPAVMSTAKVGLGSRLGSMFSSKGMDLGVNAGLSLFGMHSQKKAADQARADTLAANREAIALQRQQLEETTRNANLDRADAKAANDAINELKKRELDAAEEERAYNRSLVEQREARLAPYRQRGQQALDRLASMWSLS